MPSRFLGIVIGTICAWFGGWGFADDRVLNPPAFVSEGGQSSPRPDVATYVVVPAPADMDALLERLARPDFVVLDWARYSKLKGVATTPGRPDQGTESSIRSVLLRGDIGDSDARLRLVLTVHQATEEAQIVPIGLNDVFIQSARAGDKDLLVSKLPSGEWGVTLKQAGDLEIEIVFEARVLSRGFERRLTLPFPESASTGLDVCFPEAAKDLRLGGRSLPLLDKSTDLEGRVRCTTAIGPRDRLELLWLISTSANQSRFSVNSEMDMRVEKGLAHWESVHQVQVDRGSITALEVRVDPFFSDYKVEVDGIPIDFEIHEDSRFRLNLGTTAMAGDIRSIKVFGSRKLQSEKPLRENLRGIEFPEAAAQDGWLTVRSDRNMHVECSPISGVSESTSRSGLPARLQAGSPLPSFVFRTREASFDLGLQIEAMRPWVWVDSRSTFRISPTSITNDLWLDYQTQRPRPRELILAIPANWALDSIGPDSAIESTTVTSAGSESPGGSRLIVQLKEQANETTRFSIHCVCRWSGPKVGDVVFPWMRPLEAATWTGTTTVYATTDLHVQPALDESLVRLTEPSEDRKSGISQPFASDYVSRFTLQHVLPPSDLRLTIKPETLKARANREIEIYVDRALATMLDQVVLTIDQGIIQVLDLVVPEDLKDNWEIEGIDISHREVISLPDSPAITRLHLVSPHRDRLRFRIRSRLPVPAHGLAKAARMVVRPVQLQGVTFESDRVEVGGSSGLEIEPEGREWYARNRADSGSTTERDLPFSRISHGPDVVPVSFLVRSASVLRLPDALISRMWITSTLLPDDSVGVELHAFIEQHRGELPIILPPDSAWKGIRVGESPGELLMSDPKSGTHVIALPRPEAQNGFSVHLSYLVPPTAGKSVRWTPRFPRQIETLEVAWEARVPAGQCVLGVPTGWEDANHWNWDRNLFRRHPNREPAQLMDWIENGNSVAKSQTAQSFGVSLAQPPNRVLFHLVGNAVNTQPWVVNRVGLIALSSTAILLPAIVAILGGFAFSRFLVVFLLALAFLATLGPSVVVAQCLQSGIAGLILAGATAAVTSWRNPTTSTGGSTVIQAPSRDTAARRSTATIPASDKATAQHNSGDSTLIRPRSEASPAHLEEPTVLPGMQERPVSSIQKG